MAIHELNISGYRSIAEINLRLNRVNVITGPNGCGKSNLYKAVHLIAQTAKGQLTQTFADEGGFSSALWAGARLQLTRTPKPTRLALSVRTETFGYEFQCGLPIPSQSAFGRDPEVKEEYVWHGTKRRPSTTLLDRKANTTWLVNHDGARVAYPASLSQSESVLAQLQEPHLYPELSSLRHEMKQWRFYHHFRTDSLSPIRAPQVGIRSPILSNDGHDLAAALQTIKEIGNPEWLDQVIDRAFPGAKLIIQNDNKARFETLLKMPDIFRPLEANELSDGTLRYLCLVAALLSPRPPKLLALNEPETSLHPDLLMPLAELIAEASRYSQLWITTHSMKLADMISQFSGEPLLQLKMGKRGTELVSPQEWQ